MNFLAHLYLSGENKDLSIGNFIADFIKGSEFIKFPEGIQQGIILHRAIDDFTDSHPVVLESKKRLQPIYRHYSGVIVDIYYDHYLALDWNQFHTQSLRNYVDSRYALLNNNINVLPLKTKQMLPYMIQNDWLYNYQYFEGIQKVMNGMSGRSKFNSKMEKSVKELQLYHEDFRKEFHLFFPELIKFSHEMTKNF